jgi:transposase
LRHLPIFNRPVYLTLHTKRYRCLHCDDRPTTTQRGDWYDAQAHCTKAFTNYLLFEMVNSTLSDVALKHQVTYDLLRGLLTRYVSTEVDWSQLQRLRVIGLDETSLLKGHSDFVTIVSTRDEQGHPVLLAVLEGREKETVVAFLQSIPQRLRQTVEQVCTDLYEATSTQSKKSCLRRGVVADRFHLAKLYRAAVDELRKGELRALKQVLKPEEYAAFKGVMWMLRRHRDDLTNEELEILELLFDCSPSLRQAYQLREKLTRIFEANHTKESARRALRAWINQVKGSGLTCFNKFLGTLGEVDG